MPTHETMSMPLAGRIARIGRTTRCRMSPQRSDRDESNASIPIRIGDHQ